MCVSGNPVCNAMKEGGELENQCHWQNPYKSLAAKNGGEGGQMLYHSLQGDLKKGEGRH